MFGEGGTHGRPVCSKDCIEASSQPCIDDHVKLAADAVFAWLNMLRELSDRQAVANR